MKNKIDKTDICWAFLNVIQAAPDEYQKCIDLFKDFIEKQMERELSQEENLKMLNIMLKYVQSEPGTPERLASMTAITELEFITA